MFSTIKAMYQFSGISVVQLGFILTLGPVLGFLLLMKQNGWLPKDSQGILLPSAYIIFSPFLLYFASSLIIELASNLTIESFKNLSIPLIGSLTLYLAYRQHINDQNKLRFELFEKRFKVYQAVKLIHSEIVTISIIPNEKIAAFNTQTRESIFLFDEDVNDYINNIRESINELQCLQKITFKKQSLKGNDVLLIKREKEVRDWMADQNKRLDQVFYKYLHLDT